MREVFQQELAEVQERLVEIATLVAESIDNATILMACKEYPHTDFGDRAITWEGRSCHPRGLEGVSFGAAFYGEQGTLVTDSSGYALYDAADQVVTRQAGEGGDEPHLRNFVECLRGRARPTADIADGHKATLLCHLGNIAWRVGRTLHCDPASGRILGDHAAARLWTREYRRGWTPRI